MEDIHALIIDLARYEQAAEQVSIDVHQLRRDFTSSPPRFECLIAEVAGEIAGMALFYPRYSTWKGPTCYLEDLVVRSAYRRKGIGRALMGRLQDLTTARGLARLEWQVLDWNSDAIAFYEQLGAETDGGWMNMRFEYEHRQGRR